MAYRLGKALPSEWQEYMKTKSNLFGAIAHFHTGPINSNERVLSERLTRLTLAKEMIETSLRHANRFGGILQDIVQVNAFN